MPNLPDFFAKTSGIWEKYPTIISQLSDFDWELEDKKEKLFYHSYPTSKRIKIKALLSGSTWLRNHLSSNIYVYIYI